MNVVIAIDSFKGSMTSLEAGESASAGIRRIYPDADIAIRPTCRRWRRHGGRFDAWLWRHTHTGMRNRTS